MMLRVEVYWHDVESRKIAVLLVNLVESCRLYHAWHEGCRRVWWVEYYS